MDVTKELEAAGWERMRLNMDTTNKYISYVKEREQYFVCSAMVQEGSRFDKKNPTVRLSPEHYLLTDMDFVVLHTAATPELLLTKIKLLGLF